jgi:hypothetical protein
MSGADGTSSRQLSNADLARVLSPLLFFLAHLVYLAFWSPEPFLKKWIDGSFTFFVALVLCNIIRARLVAAHAAHADEEHEMSGSGQPAQTGDHAGPAANTRAGEGQASR